MVKVGLIARADDRGLGVQTWEWFRHMNPDATLVVSLGDAAGPFVEHRDRYPGATWASWAGSGFTDPHLVRSWLEDVDVLYTAETLYDPRMAAWCDAAGVTAYVHVNPELWRDGRRERASVATWAPTGWRVGHLPPSTVVMPVPVPTGRWKVPAPERANDAAVFLHVVGKRALGDRNGTNLLLAAVQSITVPFRVRLVTQEQRLPVPRVHPNVHVEIHTGGVEDYWRLYDDADVVVLPRRYGGLCLPANEAAGAGLAIVMTDVAPNHRWPIEAVRVAGSPTLLSMPAGQIPAHTADSHDLVATLTRMATDTDLRHQRQQQARQWALEQSWNVWEPEIREAMTCE